MLIQRMGNKLNLLFLAKLFTIFCVVTFSYTTASAQEIYNSPVDYYNVPMKRLLAISAGNYINQITQNQLDPDSSSAMACKIYHINRLLPYNEGYDGDLQTPGMALIDQGKINEVKMLLKNQQPINKLRTLEELSCYYLYKPQPVSANLDTALGYISQAAELVKTLNSKKMKNSVLNLYGQYYFKKGDVKTSETYFKTIVNSLASANESRELATALLEQATFLPYNDPLKFKTLNSSLDLCKQYNLPIIEIRVLTALATVLFPVDFQKAMSYVIQVGDLQKKIGFRHRQYVYDVLAFITNNQSKYQVSLNYSHMALQCMQATGDRALSSVFYLRMGQNYHDLGQFDTGLQWLQKGLDGPKSKQTQVFWYVCFLQELTNLIWLNRIGQALALINEINVKYPPANAFDRMQLEFHTGECYLGIGAFSKAEQQIKLFLDSASKYPPEYSHVTGLPVGYYYITKVYIKERKFKEAEASNRLARQTASTPEWRSSLSGVYYNQYQLDSAAGKFQSALQNYKIYQKLYDSAINVSQAFKYNELRIQYDAEGKDKDIKILTKNDQLKTNKLKQSDFIKNIILIGAILFAIIAALLYYLFQTKQKSNRLLQVQQSEITEKNIDLEHLVKEKEWLVKEIHHRVKNNLHTIVSLLESQTAYLGNDALAAVRDSQHRIHAMSLIHQKLYLSENVSSVNMSVYIRELTGYLKESFKTDNTIYFNLEVEPIELDVAIAIPLGLILNEAITNSIKYAFGEAGGEVTLQLIKKESFYLLTIADNGIGISTDFQQATPVTSLGMTLMKGLCKEIGAEFQIKADKGTNITIKFSGKNLEH